MIVPTGGKAARRARHKTGARSAFASKVYFPRNPLEVVLAMQEARALGQPLSIRGPGDQDEGDVHGAVLSVARLDRVLAFDRAARTVTVEPGTPVAALEVFLAGEGFGLKVTSGEPGRVVGSVAATLGVGPTSHRSGLFTDQVVALTQVCRDGSSRHYRREQEGPAGIVRRLTMGQDVTVNLTLEVVLRDKRQALVRQQMQRFTRLDDFVDAASEHVRVERGALLKFARMVDLAPGTSARVLGAVVSGYEVDARLEPATRIFARGQAAIKRRTPSFALPSMRAARSALSLCERRYLSFAEAERQPWRGRALDDGVHAFHVLAGEQQCEQLIYAMHRLCARYFRAGVIDALALTVSGVRSPYLAGMEGGEHCELRLELLSGPCRGEGAIRDEFAAAMDGLCLQRGARRIALPSWRADARPS